MRQPLLGMAQKGLLVTESSSCSSGLRGELWELQVDWEHLRGNGDLRVSLTGWLQLWSVGHLSQGERS